MNRGTIVYGASDDLIEFDGEYGGEVGCYGTEDRERGVLVVFSDGTIVEVKYGKNDKAIWGINIINKGTLYDYIDVCTDEDSDPCSDVLRLKSGLKWAYAATGDWELVQ
jgi:hypothetical protein